MKKAGTRPAFTYHGSGLLLVHLVHFVGRLGRLLLVGRLLLAGRLLVGLLVHLAALSFLVHLAALVLRERGEAGRRERRRDEDCNELLHIIPLWLSNVRPAPGRSPVRLTREADDRLTR